VGESFETKDKRIKVAKHNMFIKDKRGSVMVNNKMADGTVRHFLNRKIRSKREKFRNEGQTHQGLPYVSHSVGKMQVNSEMKIDLPSHY
jgi:uncharacterized protein YacL (UPF0231 family)